MWILEFSEIEIKFGIRKFLKNYLKWNFKINKQNNNDYID